jgi:tetratricopeptide (TPR) repeat protein
MRLLAWAALCGITVCFLWGSTADGQELLRPERNLAGTLINQDFYAMDQHPETALLLRQVEGFHFNQQVFENFRQGQYRSVLGDLKYTLEKMPNHPGALSLMSTVAVLTKSNGLPIPFYENALALYPQYAFTHAQYGYYLLEIGALDKAVEHLKEATRLEPNLAPAHAWLAEAYYKSHKISLAKQEEEQARKLGHTKPIPQQEVEPSAGVRAPTKGEKKQSPSTAKLDQSDDHAQ